MAAIEEAVPADVLSAALYARFRSRQEHTFAEKMLSAMRKGFGGHRGAKVMAASKLAAIVVMGVSGAGKSTVGKIDRRASRLPVSRRRQLSPASQHREDEPRRAADR